ncbi:MAG: efflux RND transporter permease subunit [Paludibacter sp.]|nr:efflux RND transporter permease subunit [Paludibacter sp.]
MKKEERESIIEKASKQVGPGVFYSTIVVIASFLPVFMLTGMEGKMFHPLAYTKTFILIIDAFLAITLTPVLISFFLKGKLKQETANPVTRFMERIYTPVLKFCLKWRKTTIGINIVALIISIPMFLSLGTEFIPPLDEGSLLFMPVTLPDVSNSEIKRILQVQDKIIKSVPEVENVLGKAGRANTATDNSPISMIETIILLKPHKDWRPGMTKEGILQELNAKLQIPGVVNGWTQPIINRINMLSTGVRTDVGLKVYGQNLDSIYALSNKLKRHLMNVRGVTDLYVDPITGGKFIDISIRRDEIGRYGLSVDDVNAVIESALGGVNVTTTIEGRRRFNVNVRLAQDYRRNLEDVKRILIQSPASGAIPLSSVADIVVNDGPPMVNSENAMLRGAVLFNVRDRDLGSTVQECKEKLNEMVKSLPKGYYLEWSGQYENQLRATQKLRIIIPIVLLIILLVVYFTFRSFKEAFLTLITVPFALIGGVYIIYFYGINLSVAVAVGFIALFGMAIETSMLMTIYLNEAMEDMVAKKGNSAKTISTGDIHEFVIKGAVKRLRPKLMTVSVSLFGLFPVLWQTGVGSDIMLPITLPLIGGLFTSTIYVLLLTPVIFEMTKVQELRKYGEIRLIQSEK